MQRETFTSNLHIAAGYDRAPDCYIMEEEAYMLEIGTMAPDFSLQDQDGNTRKLSEYRGRKVVLYFYPKDNTPGCTKEACSLRDNRDSLDGLNAVILGVSPDKPTTHQGFIAKQSLNFTLLSDPDHGVMEAYGAWGEKTSYGKKTIGVIRSTYIIDEQGIIIKTFAKVSTATHGEDVKAFLEKRA